MKVWKAEESCMYFLLFKLHRYTNRFAAYAADHLFGGSQERMREII